jgi:hypothetical protein
MESGERRPRTSGFILVGVAAEAVRQQAIDELVKSKKIPSIDAKGWFDWLVQERYRLVKEPP